MDILTEIVHAGMWDEDPTGTSSVPLFRGSTFSQDPQGHPRWDYGRSGNPTRAALEEAMAKLEGGHSAYAFSSGIAAVNSVLMMLSTGDHVVVGEDIYGGTYRTLSLLFSRWGLSTTWVDAADLDAVRSAITDKTRAILVESPSNPLLRICDLRAIADLARERGIQAWTDNTFQTPLLQRPLDLGFHVSIHSATKFLGGHSDVVAGVAVVSDAATAKELYKIQNGFGAILGPDDSWMVLRGIRTLAARLRMQQEHAMRIASWLDKRPEVLAVHYPGLPNHPLKDIHDRQTSGPGAVMSFDLGDATRAEAFLRAVELPLTAVSLGGIETILSWPCRMSHASMPASERQRRGIGDGLLRLSVGLENPSDLEADFEAAFPR
ncbi:MAG: aminotransferase class I/II-fold pyridoxal phosphate-dependent enzyme [Fibrobacterota bacterium]|nr:aminotransferase class I/II-fold pyridoxal phosphate-dependent enzyme [Fibrobacterota bacterium]QQS04381.1 MAG: aminotransferase class I/II-fold pyridoxal phosphate-dependent enzyme [Fibrobacterota bacterium]